MSNTWHDRVSPMNKNNLPADDFIHISRCAWGLSHLQHDKTVVFHDMTSYPWQQENKSIEFLKLQPSKITVQTFMLPLWASSTLLLLTSKSLYWKRTLGSSSGWMENFIHPSPLSVFRQWPWVLTKRKSKRKDSNSFCKSQGNWSVGGEFLSMVLVLQLWCPSPQKC